MKKYISPYSGVLDTAEKIGIIPEHGKWGERLRSANDKPEYRAWADYWRELNEKEKSSGKVEIDGKSVRSWRDVDGHLLIHKDDVALLKESPRYTVLIGEARHRPPETGVVM